MFTVHTDDRNHLLSTYKCARFWLGLLYLFPHAVLTNAQIKCCYYLHCTSKEIKVQGSQGYCHQLTHKIPQKNSLSGVSINPSEHFITALMFCFVVIYAISLTTDDVSFLMLTTRNRRDNSLTSLYRVDKSFVTRVLYTNLTVPNFQLLFSLHNNLFGIRQYVTIFLKLRC